MKFNSLIPELTVRDIERTKKFYTQVLRFNIEYERPEDKFVFLSLGENQLMFEQDNGSWSTGAWNIPLAGGVNVEMSVSDVEELYGRVIAAGIKPFRRLEANRYRNGTEEIVQKEFLVQDPDGYLLRFTD